MRLLESAVQGIRFLQTLQDHFIGAGTWETTEALTCEAHACFACGAQPREAKAVHGKKYIDGYQKLLGQLFRSLCLLFVYSSKEACPRGWTIMQDAKIPTARLGERPCSIPSAQNHTVKIFLIFIPLIPQGP